MFAPRLRLCCTRIDDFRAQSNCQTEQTQLSFCNGKLARCQEIPSLDLSRVLLLLVLMCKSELRKGGSDAVHILYDSCMVRRNEPNLASHEQSSLLKASLGNQ